MSAPTQKDVPNDQLRGLRMASPAIAAAAFVVKP
jgi:hypothetical protein